jgi:large subunit ribosomal protein L21
MSYAVIKTGGKQYQVKEGDTIRVEKLACVVGDEVQFSDVLMTSVANTISIGKPLVKGAMVTGRVEEQGRLDKITIIKKKRRKHYDRKTGHRQYFTKIKISKIDLA